MKRVLALETSGELGSVALLDGDAITERSIASPREQTATVLPHVHALLADASLTLRDLDAVAFGRGPGSFTGLRVATAIAQGLGLALELPLLPVSSLAAIAQGCWRGYGIERCLVCVDARMGEVYWARYGIAHGLARLDGGESLTAPDAVDARWDAPFVAAGSGFATYPAELAGLAGRAAHRLPEACASARDLLPQALDDLAEGRIPPLEAALPAYLRRADAWRR
jgi:tRNA threonylcarbamoyladenosine biosynthesis protein TsaB